MPDEALRRSAPNPSSALPRRLPRGARRRQLIAAAVPLAARQGLSQLSLEDLAARAGVTRNLLYHYFPRGRSDVVLAVVLEAERQLAGLQGMLDHALAGTHAWRIHRMAEASADPTVRAAVAARASQLVHMLARTRVNMAQPPAVVEVVLHGYLGFAEAALEAGRRAGLPRGELLALLDALLAAALDAARR